MHHCFYFKGIGEPIQNFTSWFDTNRIGCRLEFGILSCTRRSGNYDPLLTYSQKSGSDSIIQPQLPWSPAPFGLIAISDSSWTCDSVNTQKYRCMLLAFILWYSPPFPHAHRFPLPSDNHRPTHHRHHHHQFVYVHAFTDLSIYNSGCISKNTNWGRRLWKSAYIHVCPP